MKRMIAMAMFIVAYIGVAECISEDRYSVDCAERTDKYLNEKKYVSVVSESFLSGLSILCPGDDRTLIEQSFLTIYANPVGREVIDGITSKLAAGKDLIKFPIVIYTNIDEYTKDGLMPLPLILSEDELQIAKERTVGYIEIMEAATKDEHFEVYILASKKAWPSVVVSEGKTVPGCKVEFDEVLMHEFGHIDQLLDTKSRVLWESTECLLNAALKYQRKDEDLEDFLIRYGSNDAEFLNFIRMCRYRIAKGLPMNYTYCSVMFAAGENVPYDESFSYGQLDEQEVQFYKDIGDGKVF